MSTTPTKNKPASDEDVVVSAFCSELKRRCLVTGGNMPGREDVVKIIRASYTVSSRPESEGATVALLVARRVAGSMRGRASIQSQRLVLFYDSVDNSLSDAEAPEPLYVPALEMAGTK